MNNTILSLSNLRLSYNKGKSYILKDISFSLHKWEVLSIIGKNGSWKSSLLKVIAGITPPHSGDIHTHTSKIAYVPQKLKLENSFPLKVEEFFHIFNDNIDSTDIQQAMKMFHITSLLPQSIHTLSGGEFQKVLILNALLSKPELLLLDEPTSGIDVIWEEQFYKNISLIRELYPDIAIVLVSHNLHLVYKNSSKVICLHENNLCCHGSPSEVLWNKDVGEIFGDYLTPYAHKPHNHHNY